MTEELKNKIRLERIRTLVNNHINKAYSNNGLEFYNSKPIRTFYKTKPFQFNLKDVTEADIEEWKNEELKTDCILFLGKRPSINSDLYKRFKDMNVNDVLMETYKLFLVYKIKSIDGSIDENSFNTIDDFEETLDNLINIRDEKYKKDEKVNNDIVQESKKSFWNIF